MQYSPAVTNVFLSPVIYIDGKYLVVTTVQCTFGTLPTGKTSWIIKLYKRICSKHFNVRNATFKDCIKVETPLEHYIFLS